MTVKKRVKKKVKRNVMTIPTRTSNHWMGEFLVSSLVVKFWTKYGRWPRHLWDIKIEGRKVTAQMD